MKSRNPLLAIQLQTQTHLLLLSGQELLLGQQLNLRRLLLLLLLLW
jgi:hypothetical protein